MFKLTLRVVATVGVLALSAAGDEPYVDLGCPNIRKYQACVYEAALELAANFMGAGFGGGVVKMSKAEKHNIKRNKRHELP